MKRLDFKFSEGDAVYLVSQSDRVVQHRDLGYIFCYYTLDEPAYEVTFTEPDGSKYGNVFYESDLVSAAQPGVQADRP